MHIEEDLRTYGMKERKTTKKAVHEAAKQDISPILFNGDMRKTFVEGVLQDAKGYFEQKTDGKVEETYEDFILKDHEFGFKLTMSKGRGCSKQLFNETSGALVNVLNYMFGADSEAYDLAFFTTSNAVEAELVSNW